MFGINREYTLNVHFKSNFKFQNLISLKGILKCVIKCKYENLTYIFYLQILKPPTFKIKVYSSVGKVLLPVMMAKLIGMNSDGKQGETLREIDSPHP